VVVVVVVVVTGGRVTVGNVVDGGGGDAGGGGGAVAVVPLVGAPVTSAVGLAVRRRGFFVVDVVVGRARLVRDALDECVVVPLELRRCPDTLGADPSWWRAEPVGAEVAAPAWADATGRGVWA
jgi:hypothetical protein